MPVRRSNWRLRAHISGGDRFVKTVTFSDYANRYECVSMKREDGILLLTIHASGAIDKACVWSAKPHEELSYAFNDIAPDRQNLCVIITGAGGAFCAEMHPSIAGLTRFSEGNVSTEMFERMDQAGHDGRPSPRISRSLLTRCRAQGLRRLRGSQGSVSLMRVRAARSWML